MIVKYIIGILAGWIVGTVGIMMLTILRVGLPLCYILLKKKEEDERALKELKRMYFMSLLTWTFIITLITLLCFAFLNKEIYGYIISTGLVILLGFNSTGNNENNLKDFHNSLQNQIKRIYSK